MTKRTIIPDEFDSLRAKMKRSGAIYEGDFQIGSGFQRFHVPGDKPNSKNGWYSIYELKGKLFASFGCHKRGISENWQSDSADLSFYRNHQHIVLLSNKIAIENQQIEAAKVASKLWSKAQDTTCHPYLIRKRVKSFGLKVHKNVLYVPLRDMGAKLWSLEKIYGDGTKIRLPKAKSKGCFHILGELGAKIVICEGYSTAASIYEASGICTVTAFSANGLTPVATEFRNYFPNLEIIVAADDDYDPGGNKNIGMSAATEAARTVQGRIIRPKLLDQPRVKCDFNDMLVIGGLEALKAYLEYQL